ncbi:MAG: response regulator transcription factor [Bryobacteraceae bacterium]
MPTDVLLVDDHVVVRDGIKAILERGGEFQVTGEVESGADAIQFCKNHSPGLVLMDISLPGLDGIEATTEILRHAPNARVVVLSMYDDEVHVMNAMRAGARGFVLKRASLTDLMDAMRTVAKGGSYLSPQVSDRLLRRIQSGTLQASPASPLIEGLSRREVQVLRLVAEGKSSKEIASILALELETVRSYRKTMMKKLGVNNAASLTKLAVAAGLTAIETR